MRKNYLNKLYHVYIEYREIGFNPRRSIFEAKFWLSGRNINNRLKQH